MSEEVNTQVLEIIHSAEIKELAIALCKVQSELPVAGYNKDNPFHKSKYADLTGCVMASRQILTANGLCVSQVFLPKDGINYLITLLIHKSGQWLSSCIELKPADNKAQTLGSLLTYLRRYSYNSITGVVTGDEDDDGEQAQARHIAAEAPKKPNSKPKISLEQVKILVKEVGSDKSLMDEIMRKCNLKTLADLEADRFDGALKWIKETKAKKAEVIDENPEF
jgi:hypothetical protein